MTIKFIYRAIDRDSITFERFEDRPGERGALDLMEMEMIPTSTIPTPEELPGRVVADGESGEARFVVSIVKEGSLVDAEDVYLFVSPRTPNNLIPLPMMSMSFSLERDGEVVDEGPPSGCNRTIDRVSLRSSYRRPLFWGNAEAQRRPTAPNVPP